MDDVVNRANLILPPVPVACAHTCARVHLGVHVCVHVSERARMPVRVDG